MGCISTKREVKVKGLPGIKDKRDLLTYSDNLEKEKSLNMPILKHIANRFNIKKMSNEENYAKIELDKTEPKETFKRKSNKFLTCGIAANKEQIGHSHLEDVSDDITPKSRTQKMLRKDRKLINSIKGLKFGTQKNTERINKIIEVKLKADRYENMLPIWCSSRKKIVFNVTGKWKIDQNSPEVDSRGYLNLSLLPNGFPKASLLFRVGTNKQYFNVTEETEYAPESSGPLFYFMNTDTLKISPVGALNLIIKNAIKCHFEEINFKLRWDLNSLYIFENSEDSVYFSNEEVEQLIFINKLRVNPCLFAELYLRHLINNDTCLNIKFLYETLIKSESLPPLKFNKTLKKISDMLCKDLAYQRRLIQEEEEDIKDQLNKILNLEAEEVKLLIKNVYTLPDNKPLEFVIRILINELNPELSFLNKGVKYAGISVKSDIGSECITVQCLF